jgi:DNA polymerase III epsilon subunit-like protein
LSTQKDKPIGYFKHLLAIDCETTGLCFGTESPVFNPATGERHQSVSWGIIVADSETLRPVEEMYLEIKWNKYSKVQRKSNPEFGKAAEGVHGLTYEYLEENGIDEEEAVLKIGELILKYWGVNVTVKSLGHNVHLFDLPFLRDMFSRHDIALPIGNRHYDTNSMGFATFGTWNSDELFEAVGFDPRGAHNALDDAKMALEAARRIKLIFNSCINS